MRRVLVLPWGVHMRAWLLVLVGVAGAGCGDDEDLHRDGALVDGGAIVDAALPRDASADADFVQPALLSETGLYSDIASKTVAAGVTEFAPRWQLWSDGAAKRRWYRLPPGAHIDSSNMDQWRFPVGTQFWKEFARGGRRVETRLLQKIGPGEDWFMVSFAWNAGETEAMAVPGGVVDEPGHDDIPQQSECFDCHAPVRLQSVVIGFSALQLDDATRVGGSQLAALVAAGKLSAPPAGGSATTPYFPLPAGDAATRDALGYLHANCGNCHNPGSDVKFAVDLELRLGLPLPPWSSSAAYRTAVDVVNQTAAPPPGASAIIEPGMPGASALYLRLTSEDPVFRMPPLARELADPVGGEAVRAWIASLPATP